MICHAPTLNAKGGSGVAVEEGRMADVMEGAVAVVVVGTKDGVETFKEGTLHCYAASENGHEQILISEERETKVTRALPPGDSIRWSELRNISVKLSRA